MRIRRAIGDDAPQLAALRWEFRSRAHGAVDETEAAFVERCAVWMRVRLAQPSVWTVWLAEEDDRAVGQIWVQLVDKLPNPTAEPERHAYISNVYVRPAARGGVGMRLLDACLSWLDEQQVDSILLWPSPPSRSLYERHGFAISDGLLIRRGQSGTP